MNPKKPSNKKNGKEKSGSDSEMCLLYVAEQTYPPSARTGYTKNFLRTGVRKIIFARTHQVRGVDFWAAARLARNPRRATRFFRFPFGKRFMKKLLPPKSENVSEVFGWVREKLILRIELSGTQNIFFAYPHPRIFPPIFSENTFARIHVPGTFVPNSAF